jgi:hypothetical protein
MRPTFSRFDIHDLLDTLPPFARHPMALATVASVLAHGAIAVGLPLFAESEEEKPERIVDVISLSPAEQGKLPSNGLMMPGGGLNGTSALPLPLTKNGALSPLSGLSGSTLGSSGSSYSGVPGLLDPPIISYTQPSSRTSSDLTFRSTPKTTRSLTGFTGNTIAFDIGQLTQTEEKPTDPTKGKDKTELPPGEKPPAQNLPVVQAGNPENPSQPLKGTLEQSADNRKTPNQPPTQPQQPPSAPVPTVAQALGPVSFGEKTKQVDNIALTTAQAATYADFFDSIAKQQNLSEEKVLEQSTVLRPQELAFSLPFPKTSDAITEQPVPAEFIAVLTPQGKLLILPGQDGKPALRFSMLRETGYANLNKQALDYLQTQIPVLQQAIDQQIASEKLKKFDKYSYLKLIFTPAATAVT